MNIEALFFELLQVAVGNRRTLSVTPTVEQWIVLFEMSKKHALSGIAFKGYKDLRMKIPDQIYFCWLGLAARIQQRNKEVIEACVELVKDLEHDGFYSCILKGQGNLVNYPENLRLLRTPGDIDVLCTSLNNTGNSTLIEYALKCWRARGCSRKPDLRYHHIDFPDVNGVQVEMHFRPLYLSSPFRNNRFQKWAKTIETKWVQDLGFNIPTGSFNTVYQLAHIYRHLFDEGVGFRQLMDYYFVLKAFHNEQGLLDNNIMHVLDMFGLKQFAGAVMYVLREVLAMPSDWMICEPDEVRGRHLLDEVMLAGNMGAYDPRKGDLTHETALHKFFRKTKRNLALAKYYPHEALWEPVFRVYHWFWRKSFCLS